MLASIGSRDKTVRLWDVRAHKLLVPLTSPTDYYLDVAFSRDGRTLVFAVDESTDQGVVFRFVRKTILWRNRAELQAEVCNLVGSLSSTEWTQNAAGISYRHSCP